MRASHIYQPNNMHCFKKQLLDWSQQFREIVWLDSNEYPNINSQFDAVLAVDAFTSIQTDYFEAFKKLDEYQTTTKDWIFGFLTYDLKNATEQLNSTNFDALQFPDLFFFQPKKLFLFSNKTVELLYLNMVEDEIIADIEAIEKISSNLTEDNPEQTFKPASIKARMSKNDYLEKVKDMLAHIYRGDIYEANFCQEFYAEKTVIQPLNIFNKLNAISQAPFTTFLKLDDKYLLSASPERYLQKNGQTILSQPIKGTAKRASNPKEDDILKQQLEVDTKERSENIMIVDLVRNDLAQTAVKGSIQVTELCAIYSFKQVHQMISTIQSEIAETTHSVDVLKTTFPMGSMTGAPKISAMKIIEKLEVSKRGLYSGAVGYFTPHGNFDFNVIIRSIIYNEKKQYVSFSVGSAITAKSVPEKEYEECLIKAKAMREVLES